MTVQAKHIVGGPFSTVMVMAAGVLAAILCAGRVGQARPGRILLPQRLTFVTNPLMVVQDTAVDHRGLGGGQGPSPP